MSESPQPLPVRTVVWMASGPTPPSALLNALAAKGRDVSAVGSAPAVIVALARGGVGEVVLVAPERLPRASELIEALRTYYPGVVALRCDQTPGDRLDAGRPVLTIINGRLQHHAATDRAPRETPSADTPSHAALPRLVRPDEEASPDRDDDGPLITDEELSMLLGPIPQRDEP